MRTKDRNILLFSFLTSLFFFGTMSGICQQVIPNKQFDPRRSPVSHYMSFNDSTILKQDFIVWAKKKPNDTARIDFPDGKFGKGIRVEYIPAPPSNSINLSGMHSGLTTAAFGNRPGNTNSFAQPFTWGAGKINTRLGAVAFWAKGKPPVTGLLYELGTTSFGRLERDLIGIGLDENNKLFAFLRDARYVRHELKTDIVWNADNWNHIVLNWDWLNGLELLLNGKKVASSWGTDGWFETAPPGLFHLPIPGIVYDELYLMDRPLAVSEIATLIASNTAPKNESPVYTRTGYDPKRVAQLSGADISKNLPIVSPANSLTLSEIFPTGASDGYIQGWHVIDGRNEMAWPHEYSLFTIIPGDGDFHADKVDITIPATSLVNYVVLTGNLTNVKVQELGKNQAAATLLNVPAGKGFLYGSTITSAKGSTLRIPFTEKYGTPNGFNGDVMLPLSGEKRLQEIGLYHFSNNTTKNYKPAGDKQILSLTGGMLDERTQFSMHAITSRDERKIAIASSQPSKEASQTIDIGAFSRLNILSIPYQKETGVTAVTLSLPVKTSRPEQTVFVRVHDAALPLRLWNQFAVQLKDFDKSTGKLLLTIDFQDMVLTGADRLWIDIGSVEKCEVKIGDDSDPAELYIQTTASAKAVNAYAAKEMTPNKGEYSKMYEFMPWKVTRKKVSLEKPESYGGAFDMIMPALAVRRVTPDDFAANFMIKMAGPDFRDGQRINVDPPLVPYASGTPDFEGLGETHPARTALITLDNPLGAPTWALYMQYFNKKRWAMARWWAMRQNPDGQIGGGWNDDTLFGSRDQPDMPLDGNTDALKLQDSVHTGIERTKIFKDGYCQIYPIDLLHTGDFISERYTTVVNNLGQAYVAEREMESARRLGKPEETPNTYYDGAFKSAVNVFNWYWGKDVPVTPYVSKPLSDLAVEFRHFASVFDDFCFYRMTEARVHTDDYTPYGAREMYTYTLGGPVSPRIDAHLKPAVMWPAGGGPDVARVILKADDISLDAVMYSFDNKQRNVQMRLARINDGRYRIGLYTDTDGNGNAGTAVWTTEKDLSRFDIVNLPVPPHQSLVLKVEQLKSYSRPAQLADLAIDGWDAVSNGSTVTAMVHNLGNGKAENITVRLLAGNRIVEDKVISRLDPPTDFVLKRTKVSFTNVPVSKSLKIVIDPDNKIKEILEENNNALVVPISAVKKKPFSEN